MRAALPLFCALMVSSALAQGKSKAFPPGWNGMALTPPQGWRSWNAFGAGITQAMMVESVDAVVAKNRTVMGWAGKVSLCDLGYCAVGIDEGWEGCGMGVQRTPKGGPPYMSQHYANGTPVINAKFPDMMGLVTYGHSKGVKMGWYENGCACGEKVEVEINYEGDVKMLHDFGFDAVKLDGCGKQRNMTLYAQLMKESGKNYSIENCHWGTCTNSDDSSCPTQDWCPFNWFRVSTDINAGSKSWYWNLQHTIPFQSWEAPISQPGCWAYPDMLEVGRVAGTLGWNRAHFGAWCIVSAPLVLGMALTDAELDPVLDIIGNKLALGVNQAWAGHPGGLVRTLPDPPPPPPAPGGCFIDGDVTYSGGNVMPGPHHGVQIVDSPAHCCATCQATKNCSFYTCDHEGMGNKPTCYGAPGRCCWLKSVDAFKNRADCQSGGCQSGSTKPLPSRPPVATLKSQLWAKPIEGGAVAVLFINGGTSARSTSITLSELNITASFATVTDIWNGGAVLGKTTAGAFAIPTVNGTDSAFLIFTPHTV